MVRKWDGINGIYLHNGVQKLGGAQLLEIFIQCRRIFLDSIPILFHYASISLLLSYSDAEAEFLKFSSRESFKYIFLTLYYLKNL